LACLTLLLALGHGALHLPVDVLSAVPALLLLVPLLAGRYVGETRIGRLAGRRPRRRPAQRTVAMRRRPVRSRPRGGRLIAVSLAERGPPGLPAAQP
jgi:hypothetical protein